MKILFLMILMLNFFLVKAGEDNLTVKDKSYIKNCINKIILHYKSNPKEIDPKNFFEPYAKRQIEVNIDSISYRRDSLIAVIFLVIEVKKNGISKYDGRAIMGYREVRYQPFKLYPLTQYNIISYPTYKEASQAIKNCYLYKIKDDKDRFENKFNRGLISKDFWQKSLYFKKVKDRYYFQTYLGKEDEYINLEYPYCE